MKSNKHLLQAILFLLIILAIEGFLLLFKDVEIPEINWHSDNNQEIINQEIIEDSEDKEEEVVSFKLELSEETDVVYTPYGNKGYRYGPSIIKYDDGTMDMWMSRPGNSSTHWDYISYCHYDGDNWSDEETVLWPTSGSKDQCSVCDPAVIYVNGYYYLGYTATSNYELKGTNNSAFVARSEYPDGPFEKWNGSSWGGNPEPIIEYEGDSNFWGIGELSFVADDEDLFVYYSYVDSKISCIRLAKADLTEDWPLTLRKKKTVAPRYTEDSFDVVYAKDLDMYLAFTVRDRMSDISELAMYWSYNGKDLEEAVGERENFKAYSHNLGIAKDEKGHISTKEPQTIGYAYGKEWGSWSLVLQDFTIIVE